MGSKLKTAVVVALGVWFLLWLPLPNPAHSRAESPVSTTAAAAPIAPQPSTPRASSQEMSSLASLADSSAIKLAGSGKVFYVFSDPNCPYCRQLERTLENMGPDAGFQPVILPVAYQKGSKELASAVLCSKDAQVAQTAWREVLLPPDGGAATAGKDLKPCNAGDKKVAANMAVFEAMGLNSTPVVIAPGGTLITGSGDPDPAKLRAVLAAN